MATKLEIFIERIEEEIGDYQRINRKSPDVKYEIAVMVLRSVLHAANQADLYGEAE